MGAMPWQELGPPNPDPLKSLRELQASYFAKNYDLPRLIEEHLRSAREAVRITEEEGDEYGILDVYKADLKYLEGIAASPLPNDVHQQIVILRKIWESGGQGIGNVLDVENVTDDGGVHIARRMSVEEFTEILGTPMPTRSDAAKLLGLIADKLGRGESVCIPVYESDQQCGWWFAGYTVD